VRIAIESKLRIERKLADEEEEEPGDSAGTLTVVARIDITRRSGYSRVQCQIVQYPV
jgi:hypothetical protein